MHFKSVVAFLYTDCCEVSLYTQHIQKTLYISMYGLVGRNLQVGHSYLIEINNCDAEGELCQDKEILLLFTSVY